MGLGLDYIDGQTPFDEDEKEGLRITTITTREELDEFEQQNIEQAIQWTLARKFKSEEILKENFVKKIHERMFGDVWKWAGKFRQTNKNIGVDKWQIGIELKKLLDDCLFWIETTVYPPEEIAVRFKHKLVSIHCFPNGNGRHSRLMADLIVEKIYHLSPFSWGAASLVKKGEARTAYLKALKAADTGDYVPLLNFARS